LLPMVASAPSSISALMVLTLPSPSTGMPPSSPISNRSAIGFLQVLGGELAHRQRWLTLDGADAVLVVEQHLIFGRWRRRCGLRRHVRIRHAATFKPRLIFDPVAVTFIVRDVRLIGSADHDCSVGELIFSHYTL